MKSYLWSIAFTISLVQVLSQTFEDHSPQTLLNAQLPFPTAFPGFSRRQYGASETLQNQGLNSGYFSQQQIGLPLSFSTATPYQSSVDYQQYPPYSQTFQPSQFQPVLRSFQFENNGPVGGRSASRALRLQHLYTKAGPSRTDTFVQKQLPTILPYSINSAFAPISVTPTASTYSLSTPKSTTFPQLTNTISTVPSLPSIPSAPPLPVVPSAIPQIKTNYAKQSYSSDASYSLTSSIPIAEGHSVGNGMAYTFNTGFGNALNSPSVSQPFAFPPFTGFAAQPQVFSGTSLGSNSFNFPNTFQSSSSLQGFSPYSFGTTGFDNNFGSISSFGGSYGDDFAKIFNTVFKRDSKLKNLMLVKKESKVTKKTP